MMWANGEPEPERGNGPWKFWHFHGPLPLTEEIQNLEEYLDAADSEMHRAKRSRTVSAPPESPP